MSGTLTGRALKDFIGVAGVKMRHARSAGTDRLPERLRLVLQRLGISEEDVGAAARSTPKKANPGATDD